MLTIGDFAQLTHLSVRTLRRYHEAGLLEPARVDHSSGYRYYESFQIPTAQVIAQLRELDVPLAEVRQILLAPDPGARSALVAGHLDRLEAQLARTQAAVGSLQRLLRPDPDVLDVELVRTPARPAAAIEATVGCEEVLDWYAGAMAELDAVVHAPAGPAGGLYDNTLFTEDRGHALVYLPVAAPVPRVGRVHGVELAAAELAVTVHPGTHDTIDVTYGELGRWVRRARPRRRRPRARDLPRRPPRHPGPRPVAHPDRLAGLRARRRRGAGDKRHAGRRNTPAAPQSHADENLDDRDLAMTRTWPPTPLPSLVGHHIVITGGTGGIGLRTAQAFAAAGASVTIGARSDRKGEEATAAIRAAAGGAAAVIDHTLLDLADLGSVRACAAELARRGDPVDVLVNCAGVMAIPQRELTTNGFERHWGTNHLGHFALTGLLLPLMGASRQSRVITVSAQSARTARLDPSDWQSERSYAPMRTYSRSKLANILFAVELNQHVGGADVLSLPVHPGTAQTGIQQHQRGALTKWAGRQIMRVLGQPLDRVAEPLTHAATTPDPRPDRLVTPSGLLELGGPPHLADLPPAAHDADLRQALWQESIRTTDVRY